MEAQQEILAIKCTCCLYGAGRNDFDLEKLISTDMSFAAGVWCGKSNSRDLGMAGPKIVSIFRAHLLQWPSKWHGPKKVSIFRTRPF
jgi:hypothetical protein